MEEEPLPDDEEPEEEEEFDRWEARDVWRFDTAWETGAPVGWEFHEGVYERDGIYYYVDSSDGVMVERLGRFNSDDEAIEAGKRVSRLTDDERGQLVGPADEEHEHGDEPS